MLKIDPEVFNRNLQLTQAYCEQRLAHTDKNFAAMFRSINPKENGRKIFQFSLVNIPFENPILHFDTIWRLDPYTMPTLYDDLFEAQLEVKGKKFNGINGQIFHGEIFAFQVDETLNDGAASFSSHGFLDTYNCPPIDTWFYFTNDGSTRVLLAWIPIQLVQNVDDGISVNPEGCIEWFRNWYPEEFKTISRTIENSKFSDQISGLPESPKR